MDEKYVSRVCVRSGRRGVPAERKHDPCSCRFPQSNPSDERADGIQIFPSVEKNFLSPGIAKSTGAKPTGRGAKPSQNLPCALFGVFVAVHCPPALGATFLAAKNQQTP